MPELVGVELAETGLLTAPADNLEDAAAAESALGA
jgi:hypothetical protein